MNNDIPKDAAELLPCPFCGDVVTLAHSHVTGEGEWIAHTNTNCPCSFSTIVPDENGLINAWNTRATAADKERIAELERKLSLLPADWLEDASLETWFPMAARELKQVHKERHQLQEQYNQLGLVECRQRGELLELRAQLAAKTQECEGLRDDGDLLWKVRKMIARLLVVHTPHLTDDRLVEVIDRMTAGGASLRNRITEYLCVGGLFNPEAMEHDKVRDLLMDVRNYLDSARKEGK